MTDKDFEEVVAIVKKICPLIWRGMLSPEESIERAERIIYALEPFSLQLGARSMIMLMFDFFAILTPAKPASQDE